MKKLLSKSSSVRSSVAIADFTTYDSPATDKASVARITATGAETLKLSMSIHRSRLAAVTAASILVVCTFTLIFSRGMALSHFESKDKDSVARTKLLDSYNSYSGTVASVFAKPIEMFATISAHLVILRFMARAIVQPKPKWTVAATTLGLAVVFGYLISNGFTALNVQLRPLTVEPMISATDLSTVSNFSNSELAPSTTNASHTVSEATPSNPITNTVLRNLVLPPMPRVKALCTGTTSAYRGPESETETSLQLNFPQRAWQESVLSTALQPKQLRMVVNPSIPSANKDLKSSDLPMNASLAADLVIYSLRLGSWIFPSDGRGVFFDATAFQQRYADKINSKFTDSAPRMNGLLPRDQRDESAQREYFLNASANYIFRIFNATLNTSKSDIVAEFSHIDISPSMTFDAFTMEFTLDPSLFKNTFSFDNNRTRYTLIDQNKQCGSKSGKCLIPKPAFAEIAGQFDPPAQVYAFRMCGTKEGREELAATFDSATAYKSIAWLNNCTHGSNSSILVVSLGKRLEADALQQNMTVNATSRPYIEYQGKNTDFPHSAVATNLRKVYTLTVGRLAWQDVDLAAEFNAKCGVKQNDAGAGCRGLTFPLAPALSTDPTTTNDQRLVVGIDAMPIGLLNLLDVERVIPDPQYLVSVKEPRLSFLTSDEQYNIRVGDVLLPHNVANFSWDIKSQNVESACDGQAENRVQQLLDNHYYIEHSLQPAYTAGVFFLLQNAAVKDVVTLGTDHQTLDFDGNSQRIAVWISTPTLNAWLTVGGCFLIAIAVLATIGEATRHSSSKSDPLARIYNPQVIARALIDDSQFPPLLVKRRVVDESEISGQTAIEGYAIDSLTLCLEPKLDNGKSATGQASHMQVV